MLGATWQLAIIFFIQVKLYKRLPNTLIQRTVWQPDPHFVIVVEKVL